MRRSDHILSNFMIDIPSFLVLMRRYHVYYSGSRTLQFFLWTTFQPINSDLDLYIPFRAYDAVLHHLVQIQGYTHTRELYRSRLGENSKSPGIYAIQRFARSTQSIDVIVSVDSGPWLPIARFWSTLLMNAVGADAALCAYPSLTLSRRGIVHCTDEMSATSPCCPPLAAIAKYTERGFQHRIHPRCWNSEIHLEQPCGDHCVSCYHVPRFLGDHHTLVIDLRTREHSTSVSSLFPATVPTVAWHLGGWQVFNETKRWYWSPSASTRPFHSPHSI